MLSKKEVTETIIITGTYTQKPLMRIERLYVRSEGLRNLLPCGKKLVRKHVVDKADHVSFLFRAVASTIEVVRPKGAVNPAPKTSL